MILEVTAAIVLAQPAPEIEKPEPAPLVFVAEYAIPPTKKIPAWGNVDWDHVAANEQKQNEEAVDAR